MAPEALMPPQGGVQSGYDARVDVWSLGITAIYLAERTVPTHGSMCATQRTTKPIYLCVVQTLWYCALACSASNIV